MTRRVEQIMSQEMVSVHPEDALADVRRTLLDLEIQAAPVLDPEGRPLGVISMRDMIEEKESHGLTVGDRMTSPVVDVNVEAPVDVAAQLMGQWRVHHLVVVDRSNKAVGFVSALDVIGGLTGHQRPHPGPLQSATPGTGTLWKDGTPQELPSISSPDDSENPTND